MRRGVLVATVLAMAASLTAAGPARADAAAPAFTIVATNVLAAPAIELTSVGSCAAGAGVGEFSTALSQIRSGFRAGGAGTTYVPCDGKQHTVYTIVMAFSGGVPFGTGKTAALTTYRGIDNPPGRYPPQLPQTVKATAGTVTPRTPAPGAPTVTFDSVKLAAGPLASTWITLTCAAGLPVTVDLHFGSDDYGVLNGTAPAYYGTCTGKPQKISVVIDLLGDGGLGAAQGVIGATVSADFFRSTSDTWAVIPLTSSLTITAAA